MSAMDGGGGGAGAQYVRAKTSVWWDIENCAVPRDCDPHAIARNISSALVEMNYCGPVSISAYGDTQGINSATQQALSSTGIGLNHVPAGVKDASDKKILVDMLFWAVDNPAPANYLLISGDRDFSNALHQLRMRRYNILLAQPPTASAALVAAAKSVWLWKSLLAGGRPLPEFELQQLRSKNYTSSPGTTQIPVSGAAQMKEPVDSYSEKPYVANQKSPSTSRGARGRANATQRNPSQTNASKTTNTPFYPSAPPPMPARPNGTSYTSAPSTRVPAFDSLNNFGHPASSSPQPRNPELKHDPKNKPDSKKNKKSKGENSKGSGEGKRPELSQNKKNPEGENSKGSGEGKGPELKHDLQKEPGSSNKKKPAGENSKGSGEGKGPELKHDLQKEPGSSNKKKPAGENSKGSCEGKGPQLEHDPQKKPEGENKKKQDGKNSKGFCAGKEQELSLNKKNPEGENSEGSGEGKGPELKHDPQKKPRSRNRKKPRSGNGKEPEGEDSKGSGEGKGPELKHDLQKEPGSSNKKKPRGENSKGSCEGEGPELKHDPQKKPEGENKKKQEGENSRGSCEGKGPELKQDPHKKPEGENSRGSCEGKGPELKHDPDKKPEGENKKPEGENSRGSCEGKGPELKHGPDKKPEGENKKVARARKGVSLKKSVVVRSKRRVSLTKLDKGKKNPPAAIGFGETEEAMDGGGGPYVNAKTSVWWDIENCAVPRGCDPHAIARNISSALVEMNYFGPVSISAYGDTHGINSTAQQALSSTGIALNHVPEGVKDASDKKILVDMLFWAVDNPSPANYLLISGDRDFSNALHQLRMRRYNILLAQPKTASVPLVAAAKNVWLWTSLLAGGRPLPEGESQQLRSKKYTSSPGTAQIPVSGAAQMKEPVDSYSGKPYVANQKSPSTSRGARGRANTIQRNPSPTNASKTTNTPFYPTAPPPMPDATQIKEPVDSYSEKPYVANQKSPYTARGHDNKQKGKNIQRNPSQTNTSTTTSSPLWTQEDHHNSNSHQPGLDFVPGNNNFTWSDTTHINGNYQNHYTQQLWPNNPGMRPEFAAGGFYPPHPNLHPRAPPPMPARPNGTSFTSAPYTSAPDIGILNTPGHPVNFNPQRRNPELKHDPKKKLPRSLSLSNSQNGNMAHNSPSVYRDEKPNHRYFSSKQVCLRHQEFHHRTNQSHINGRRRRRRHTVCACQDISVKDASDKKILVDMLFWAVDNPAPANYLHPFSSSPRRRNAGLEHDPMKISKGFCAGKRPELRKNTKKPEGGNSKGSCGGRGAEVKHGPGKKPEGEKKNVASARKGVSIKKPVVPRSKRHVSVTKQDKVWWDIENCHVPMGCDPHAIAQNISSALVNMNYCGPVSISAYGDTHRIDSAVQQALSSTGIALNHVPAGVKDASDKKILVDMLFWAVDNPAPGNYLLISGDRDFSNALHQLRMRRYNILLAQPQKASASLLAAAKSVWLWTSLLAGGPPLTEGELQTLVSNNYMSTSDTKQIPVPDTAQIKEPVDSYSEKPYVANQKSPYTARGHDNKQKGKNIQRNPSQTNTSKTTSSPLWTQEDHHNSNSHQPGPSFPRVPPSGPGLDFVPGNNNFTWSDTTHINGNYQNHYTQQLWPNNPGMRPEFAAGGFYPPHPNLHPRAPPPMPARPNGTSFTSAPYTSAPDTGILNIPGHPVNFNPQRRNPELKHDPKKKLPRSVSLSNSQNGNMAHNSPSVYRDEKPNHRYPGGPEHPPSSSYAMGASVAPGSDKWGSQGCPKPSEYVQGLIGVVLLALNTLKSERIMPTETNIADCIRYGDLKHRNTDIKKALESAIRHQMVATRSLGAMQLYVGKNEKLWKCVNPFGAKAKQIPKAKWNEINQFLRSSAGRSAILASECRYEAGTILKSKCLKDHTLGDVLQILNMVIGYKKWIVPHQSGWRPLSITIAEKANSDSGSTEGTFGDSGSTEGTFGWDSGTTEGTFGWDSGTTEGTFGWDSGTPEGTFGGEWG
ncbi:hypothetical protein NC651_029514 [Populus alba x Populus x berolinensis]|nr:hypothetical protein NC651_029514 [Populus alba x Populus x berolinensis]